jgi:hypothetical protein
MQVLTKSEKRRNDDYGWKISIRPNVWMSAFYEFVDYSLVSCRLIVLRIVVVRSLESI